MRFDAGLIENAVSSQPGIVACGLAPELHKTLHDNIPVLYAEMSDHGAGGMTVLRKALIQVFITDGMLADTNLPSQCVIVESMPLNSSGKVDAKKLASGTVTGSRYSVKPVKANGKVIDILFVPATEGELATMGAGLPEELENDPYSILSEVFAIIPDLNKGRYSKLFKIPGLRELVLKLTGFDIRNIPTSMRNTAPKMFNLAYRKFVMPMMKGVTKMSNKNTTNGFMPMFQGMMPMMPTMPAMPPVPPLPPMPFLNGQGWLSKSGKDDADARLDDFKSNVKTYWEKNIDMQKSSVDASKEQWNQFFDHIIDMQDTFVASLSDDAWSLPFLPAFSMSPKEFMEQVQEFQKMMKDHFVEQADSFADFVIKGQEQAYNMVDAAMENGKKEKETEAPALAEGETEEQSA